jgi:hypothetical protein
MCEVEGCPNVHRAKGLCSTHYAQVWYFKGGQRGGDAPSAEPAPVVGEWSAWEAAGLGVLLGGVILGVFFGLKLWLGAAVTPSS